MIVHGIFILITCLIFSAHSEIPEKEVDKCLQKGTFKVKNQNKLSIILAYDPGMEPDLIYLQRTCEVHNTFKKGLVSVSFEPGFDMEITGNEIKCANPDKKDQSCTKAFEHACAAEIVPDFASFVCCTTEGNDSCSCVGNDMLEEFNQCVALKHPSINPVNILKKNFYTNDKRKQYDNQAPLLLINGVQDYCTYIAYYTDGIAVVCSMFAEGVATTECPKE